MEKTIQINQDSRISAIPWHRLLNQLFAQLKSYEKMNSVTIKTLSGGYSGAVVSVVFPGNNLPPFTLKVDIFDRISKELTCCIENNMQAPSFNRFAQLLCPLNMEGLIKETGDDNQNYSFIAYSFGDDSLRNDQQIESFDNFCKTNYKKYELIATYLRIIKDSLNKKFYDDHENSSITKKLFDIAEIEWKTLLPIVSTATSFMPEWRPFFDKVFDAWTKKQKDQAPIAVIETLCHGDLRCANILTSSMHNTNPINTKLFIIDFGSIGYSHPLSDFARLEADLFYRVSLIQDEEISETIKMIDLIVESKELSPDEWRNQSHPFIQLVYNIRKEQVRPIAEICNVFHDPDINTIYQLLLLKHATRFIRYYNVEFIQNKKRYFYIYYILRLFKNILLTEDINFDCPPLSPPMDDMAIHDMMECGVINFFWGPERRNKYKIVTLLTDPGELWLLAHTGKSYLDDRITDGKSEGRFYKALLKRLEEDKSFNIKIVLLNPYSVEGSKLGIAEARGRLQGPELDDDYHRKHTELFRRFETCVTSYKRLKDKYPSNIDLRVSHYSTDATILLSKEKAFIEPYLIGHLSMRYTSDDKMNMPELLVQKESKLYKVAQEQFLFFWERGISLKEYESRNDDFIAEFMRSERLRRKIVVLHESWFALDPIVGCPNKCDYCFLTPFKVNNKKPYLFRPAADAYERLTQYELYRQQNDLININKIDDPRLPIPIACGNYTEMLDSELNEIENSCKFSNIEQLKNLINLHSKSISTTGIAPIFCFITKKPIDDYLKNYLITILKNYNELRIALFVSLSFLPDGIEKVRKGDWENLLKNFKIIAGINQEVNGGEGLTRRIACIHFWRPILKGLNDKNIPKRIADLKNHKAICSVVVGLKLSKRLMHYLVAKNGIGEEPSTHIPYPLNIPSHLRVKGVGELFDADSKTSMIESAMNAQYPIFLNTSCALSYAFGRPDYNASFDQCVLPSQEYINQVTRLCGIPQEKYRVENNYIRINGIFEQEKQTFLRQMLGVEVVMDSIVTTHEWSGNISKLTMGENCRGSYCPPNQREICNQFYKTRLQKS